MMVPKVRTPGDIEMTAKLLTQIELAKGFEVGRSGSRPRSRTRPG